MTITRLTRFEDLPEMLRVPEVAAWLGTSKDVVYAMVKRGELPSRKYGRLLRVQRDGLVTLKASA
jgi:excisionase family DNA binding protein